LAFPVPVKLEALAVLTDKGSGSYDCQRASPIEPTAQPEQGEARWMGDPAELDSTFLVAGELFAQEEILSRERAFGS
jgi:hypothetical protein